MLQTPAHIFYVQDTLPCACYVSYANLNQHFPILLETSNDITKQIIKKSACVFKSVYFLICQIGNE